MLGTNLPKGNLETVCTAETMKEENVIIDNHQYLFLFRSQYIYCAPKTVCESFSFSTFCNLQPSEGKPRDSMYISGIYKNIPLVWIMTLW
jgi:hypothetical protein